MRVNEYISLPTWAKLENTDTFLALNVSQDAECLVKKYWRMPN